MLRYSRVLFAHGTKVLFTHPLMQNNLISLYAGQIASRLKTFDEVWPRRNRVVRVDVVISPDAGEVNENQESSLGGCGAT